MTAYEAAPDMLAEIAPLAQQYKAADAVQDTARQESARNAYLAALLRFLAAGWSGAAGEEHELPDALMPSAYLARRAQILDQLENELGRLAIEYRSALTPLQMSAAVTAYHAVFDEMCRIGHWHGVPDPDSQLPLDDMPAHFKAQRAERIRRHRARQATP
jgi:hypothetical protein